MRVAIIGSTGLIGRRLADALVARGDTIVPLARRDARVAGETARLWDAAEGPIPGAVLEGVDAVVNLAGAPIQGKRWTAARKRELWDSRVATTQRVVESLPGTGVRTLLNGSAVGFYGGRGDEILTEESAQGTGFLPDLCAAWEGSARAAESHGVRVVLSRTGLVLAREGGILPVIARPVRLLAGGPLGGGRQWQPWIHMDDQVGMMLKALDDERVSGPYNASAPDPVRQKDLVKALGTVLGRPTVLPTPAFALRLAMGEMSEIALEGQRAVPAAMQGWGYEFAHPDLEESLRAELSPAAAAGAAAA